MKKVYLLVLSVFAASAINAQVAGAKKLALTPPHTETHPSVVIDGDRAIVWSDDFETPANWISGGPSPDFTEWGWSIGATTNSWFGFDADMGTTGSFARFRNGVPGGPSDPIEDGPFTLTYSTTIDLSTATAATLEWEQYGARFIVLQEVQVSIDGGTTWLSVGSNANIPPLTATGGSEYGKPETRSFPLHCALGGATTINLRLFWDGDLNGGTMNYIDYGWYVDDVRIVDGPNYDITNDQTLHRSGVGLAFAEGLEYYMIPDEQITTIEFSGLCSNNGGNDHTNVKMTTDIDMGGSVYSDITTPLTVLTCDNDSLFGGPAFTPASGLGNYNITYTFDGDNPDDITTGDITTDMIEVTDYMYGRDDGVITASIGNLIGNEDLFLSVGNVMDIFANGLIGAIEIAITNDADNVDQLIYADVYVYDVGADDWLYLETTPDHTITAGENGGIIKLTFVDPVSVFAGDIIMITAGHWGGPTVPRFSMCQPTVDGSVQGNSAAYGFYSLASPEAVLIRADMRDFTGINPDVNINLAVGQNIPNPFDANSSITYSLNEASNVNVQFTDVSGKVIMDLNQGTQTAGEYRIDLDANDFSEGVYFYTFTVGETQITKMMVVAK